MKYIEYIEFPSGWRPPAFTKINIEYVRTIRKKISNNGNEYALQIGKVSDEDAVYLSLMVRQLKIRDTA